MNFKTPEHYAQPCTVSPRHRENLDKRPVSRCLLHPGYPQHPPGRLGSSHSRLLSGRERGPQTCSRSSSSNGAGPDRARRQPARVRDGAPFQDLRTCPCLSSRLTQPPTKVSSQSFLVLGWPMSLTSGILWSARPRVLPSGPPTGPCGGKA